MRVLTVATLYPNAAAPVHGIFVENRLRRLVRDEGVEACVVAPVPWFPSGAHAFGRYAAYARAPREEIRFGIEVCHPRYLVLPKLGMLLSPFSLYGALRAEALRLLRSGAEFDLIDAHYLYPDAVAAALLARSLRLPLAVTARGSDLTQIARGHPIARALVRWAAHEADAVIAVSEGLAEEMAALGIEARRVRVLRNGVDLSAFRPPGDRADLRRRLGLARPTLLCVGHLIRRKAHEIAIGALRLLPEFDLLIAGEGPERGRLEDEARRLGVAYRVRFLGVVAHDTLARFYGAADALVLASSREGWANVLLEAMACGTPAVASDIPGTREVLARREGGLLMATRDAAGAAAAVRRLFGTPEAARRAAARTYAEGFGWEETSRGQRELFAEILARRRSAAAGALGAAQV